MFHPPDQKAVTALARAGDSLYTSSYDGQINSFSTATGECAPVVGAEQGSPVVGLSAAGPSTIISAALDDTVKAIDTSSKSLRCLPTILPIRYEAS